MRIREKLGFAVAAVTIIVSFTHSTTFGQTAPSQPKDWEFHVVPYLWMYGINGDATVKGVDAEVDVSFSDLLENLDFAGMIHLEAHNGTWGAYLNPIYGKLSADGEIGSIDLDIETVMAIIEFGGLYRAGEWSWGSSQDKTLLLDLLVGGRYWSLENELDADIAIGPGFGTKVKQDDDWIDLIGGARLQAGLTEKLSVLLNGNIGGLGSDFSWNFTALGGYQFTDLFALWGGYRLLDVDYEDGSGSDKFALDAQFGGPLLGFDFRF